MPQNLDLPTEIFNYRLLRIATDHFGLNPKALNDKQREEANVIAKRELFMEQAVLNSAEAQGVIVAESEVKKAVGQISSRYSDEDLFLQALQDADIEQRDLYRAVERELRVDAILNYVSREVREVDDTEVGLFYYLNREKFEQPESRTASHILITINPDYPENTAAEAFKRISQISVRIARQPRRFREEALAYSECPTSLEGGLLGRIKPGTLYPELDSVLFFMQEGGVSGVLESPLGYHLLFCEEIHEARIVPLDEVMNKLRSQLTQKQRASFQRKWLRSLLNT